MDRQAVLDALLADGAITNLMTVNGEPQIFLWVTPSPDIFPRAVVREVDEAAQFGADDQTTIVRQVYEVAFTVKAAQSDVFIGMCGLVPAAMATIGGRHIASTPDAVLAEHLAVTKAQQFEFFYHVDEEE